jgi:hypothetical protein
VGAAQRPAGGTKREHRGGMGKVDLCVGTKDQGARCAGRHGRLDQVPGNRAPAPPREHAYWPAGRCTG